MIPSYFKIEILAIQDEFVLLGHKGLSEIGRIIKGFVVSFPTAPNYSINGVS